MLNLDWDEWCCTTYRMCWIGRKCQFPSLKWNLDDWCRCCLCLCCRYQHVIRWTSLNMPTLPHASQERLILYVPISERKTVCPFYISILTQVLNYLSVVLLAQTGTPDHCSKLCGCTELGPCSFLYCLILFYGQDYHIHFAFKQMARNVFILLSPFWGFPLDRALRNYCSGKVK